MIDLLKIGSSAISFSSSDFAGLKESECQAEPMSSIKRDSTSLPRECLAREICENFLYGFKGAPSAWRRVTAHAATAGELAYMAESGRNAPRGTHRTTRRPLALGRQPTAAAAEARIPAARRTS